MVGKGDPRFGTIVYGLMLESSSRQSSSRKFLPEVYSLDGSLEREEPTGDLLVNKKSFALWVDPLTTDKKNVVKVYVNGKGWVEHSSARARPNVPPPRTARRAATKRAASRSVDSPAPRRKPIRAESAALGVSGASGSLVSRRTAQDAPGPFPCDVRCTQNSIIAMCAVSGVDAIKMVGAMLGERWLPGKPVPEDGVVDAVYSAIAKAVASRNTDDVLMIVKDIIDPTGNSPCPL